MHHMSATTILQDIVWNDIEDIVGVDLIEFNERSKELGPNAQFTSSAQLIVMLGNFIGLSQNVCCMLIHDDSTWKQ